MVLGGSYKEYPIYFVFMILIALIAVGYFDNNPIVIILSVVTFILVYLYLPRRARDTRSEMLSVQTDEI
jgi:ABC-type dipeptide/oligopeptide/nickel transport system permease subunit